MKYFESHAHYDDRRFREDREELLKELLPASGVSHIINIGCDVKSSEMSVRMADKYDYIYAAVGVHPHELYDMSSQTIEKLRELSKQKKVVAIGEIGLDYYWDEPDGRSKRMCFKDSEIGNYYRGIGRSCDTLNQPVGAGICGSYGKCT